MPTASLIKLPVMIEAYRQAAAGKIDLDAPVTLREEDKVPGSGILTTQFSAGAQFPLRDAIRLMIAYSDNTATNLVLDQIGLKSTNDYMEKLGFSNTKIHAKVFRRDTSIAPDRSRQFGLGSTTAKEMVSLLEFLHQGKLANAEHTKAMLEHLGALRGQSPLSAPLAGGNQGGSQDRFGLAGPHGCGDNLFSVRADCALRADGGEPGSALDRRQRRHAVVQRRGEDCVRSF